MEAAFEAIEAAFLAEVPLFKLTTFMAEAIPRGFLVASRVLMATPFSWASTLTNCIEKRRVSERSSHRSKV